MSTLSTSLHSSRLWWVLLLLAVMSLPLLVSKMLIVAGVLIVLACVMVLYFAASAVHGRVDSFLLAWVLAFPLGYYFLTFPRERSIFTFDRAILALIIAAIAFSSHAEKWVSSSMRKAAIAWTFFLLGAFFSLRSMENPLGASKEVLDAFLLPAVLAYCVLRNFDVRRNLSALHAATCIMTTYVAGIGVAEVLTGQDFLPLPAAIFFGEETGSLQRVNGPFATNNSFGLIGLISLFFLIFLRRAIEERMPHWQRILHLFGLSSAFVTAVLPMFRSIVLTLLLVLLLEIFHARKTRVRLAVCVFVLLGIVAVASLQTFAPSFFEKRVSDPADLYARVAQHEQTWRLFAAHPINGVGLANYSQVADLVPSSYYRGVASVGSAHDTLAAILADTGLLGFIPFVLAQIFILRAFWRLRRTSEGQLTWTFFLYVFLSYWVSGLLLTSGYYSDLNLWYLFAIAVLYKFAATEKVFQKTRPIRYSAAFLRRTPQAAI